jgi:hypothetical protein
MSEEGAELLICRPFWIRPFIGALNRAIILEYGAPFLGGLMAFLKLHSQPKGFFSRANCCPTRKTMAGYGLPFAIRVLSIAPAAIDRAFRFASSSDG